MKIRTHHIILRKMHSFFSVLFLFLAISLIHAQSSQLTVTTYPSCPDAMEGSASILPMPDLLQQYPDVEDWSIEYENLSTGEYEAPYLLFPPPSFPTLPIWLHDLNPGTYEAILYLDRKYECRIEFDFFVDIEQGCACPELLADAIVYQPCKGKGAIELQLTEFQIDRGIEISWYSSAGPIPYYGSNIDDLSYGEYFVHLEDDYGCHEDHQFNLYLGSHLESTQIVYEDISPSCGDNGSIVLKIEAETNRPDLPIHYYWSNGERTESIYNLEPGTYFLTISTGLPGNNTCYPEVYSFVVPSLQRQSCLDESQLIVKQPVTVNDLGSLEVIPYGGNFPYRIEWNDGFENVFKRDYLSPGTYCYTVFDGGCCYKEGCGEIMNPCNEYEIDFSVTHRCSPNPDEIEPGVVEIVGIRNILGENVMGQAEEYSWRIGGWHSQEESNRLETFLSGEVCVSVNIQECLISSCTDLYNFRDFFEPSTINPTTCDVNYVDNDFPNNMEDCCTDYEEGYSKINQLKDIDGLEVAEIRWYISEYFYDDGSGWPLEWDRSQKATGDTYYYDNSYIGYPHEVEVDVIYVDPVNPSNVIECTILYKVPLPELYDDGRAKTKKRINVNRANPCIGFCNGKISIEIDNIEGHNISIFRRLEPNGDLVLVKEADETESEVSFLEMNLCGNELYKYLIHFSEDCEVSLEIPIGEDDYDKEFVPPPIDQGHWLFECVYDVSCGDEYLGRDGEPARIVNHPGCTRRRRWRSDAIGSCGKTEYWCREDYLITDAEFDPNRNVHYYDAVEQISVLTGEPRENVEYLLRENSDSRAIHPCTRLDYCANDPLNCFHIKGWQNGAPWYGDPQWEGNCVTVWCGPNRRRTCFNGIADLPKGYDGNNWYNIQINFDVAPETENPRFDNPDIERNCNFVAIPAGALKLYWNAILQEYNDFEQTELGQWAIDNWDRPEIYCAHVSFCCTDFGNVFSDINEVVCSNETFSESWPYEYCEPIFNEGNYTVGCQYSSCLSDGDQELCRKLYSFPIQEDIFSLLNTCGTSWNPPSPPLPPIKSDSILDLNKKGINHDFVEIRYGPNPVIDFLNIHFSEASEYDIALYRSDGLKLRDFTFDRIESASVDFSNLPAGLYSLMVSNQSFVESFKIIKIK